MTAFSEKELWELFTLKIFSDKKHNSNHLIDTRKPIVSDYIKQIGFNPIYPNNCTFAAIFSHDVDFLYPPMRRIAAIKRMTKNFFFFNNKKTQEYAKYIIDSFNPSNYKLDLLIDFLNKKNIKSTFFFLALNFDDFDYKYDLKDELNTIKYLSNEGFEIALHGDQGSSISFEKTNKQKIKFIEETGINPIGFRNHLLNFDIQKSWSNLQKAGFIYDSTIGFSNNIGFRSGMAFPYNPYCNNENDFLNIFEIPLIIMDISFFKYLNYSYSEAIIAGKKIIDEAIRCNGLITILLHPNNFKGKNLMLAEELVNYINDKGGWITTNSSFIDYWCLKGYHYKVNDIIKSLIKS